MQIVFTLRSTRSSNRNGNLEIGFGKVGNAVFAWRLLRLTGCLVLLGLSVVWTTLQSRPPRDFYAHIAICVTLAYTVLLGAVSTFGTARARKPTSDHLTILLLVIMVVYAYRDLYPLAFYGKQPMDVSAGRFLWPTVSILAFTSIGTLLLTPREHVSVDPKHPTPSSSPEQTASPLSFALWSFLDPLIIMASRVAHLGYDQFPPLLDVDAAKTLVAKSFPSLLMLVQAFAYIASPIGITGILDYLEKRGEGASVRPWVWVAWLFLGPTIASIAGQLNEYFSVRSFGSTHEDSFLHVGKTRTLVRTEGIITQLIFEHSLRIRMKAEARSSSGESGTTQTGTPDSRSVAGASTGDLVENGGDAASSGKSKKRSQDVSESSSLPGAPREKPKSSGNLVGLVNNLVTTDLANIGEARHFIFLLVYFPIQIVVCITYLYQILGWSSLVGAITMAALFPLPGLVANRMQHVEAERLKQTDSRVQAVTETLGVLRMIKLFGWENKMDEKISSIREQELYWQRKSQILRIVNNNV
ncbi:hypothetical protein HWV62_27283, partial [Athelia sp. TMB]